MSSNKAITILVTLLAMTIMSPQVSAELRCFNGNDQKNVVLIHGLADSAEDFALFGEELTRLNFNVSYIDYSDQKNEPSMKSPEKVSPLVWIPIFNSA